VTRIKNVKNVFASMVFSKTYYPPSQMVNCSLPVNNDHVTVTYLCNTTAKLLHVGILTIDKTI